MSTEKTLVIGSTGHSHVKSVRWDQVTSINIVDFDLVVVNCHSLTEDVAKKLGWTFFKGIRKELARLLKSQGRIVALGAITTEFKVSDHFHHDTYSWSPIDLGTRAEQGDTITIHGPPFGKLLSRLKNWRYWYFVPHSCLTRELTEVCGDTYEYSYVREELIHASNRYDRMLAGSVTFTITPKEGGKAHRLGALTILPHVEGLDDRSAVNLVLEDLLSLPQATLPPNWVETLPVPGIAKIDIDIASNNEIISATERKNVGLLEQRRDLEAFRKLIYASGIELEEIFATCLSMLGGTITPAKYSQEEFVLTFDGKTYLVECKGISKSVSLAHLRQLQDYVLKYEEDEGVAGKGILFGNAWKELPLAERETPDTPTFPDNVSERAASLGISLVSSTSFFTQFCRFLEGTVDGGSLLKSMTEASGVAQLQ